MSLVILYHNNSLKSLYRGGAEKQENDKPDMEWGNVCVTSQYPFYPPTNISSISNHEFHETCHSVTFLYRSIHTKDESKRGTVFAFIFGVN